MITLLNDTTLINLLSFLTKANQWSQPGGTCSTPPAFLFPYCSRETDMDDSRWRTGFWFTQRKGFIIITAASMCLHLIQILPSEEGLIDAVFLKEGRESLRLLGLLPCSAAAVALQRVVDHMMVMRVFARQDARPAGTAKGTGDKLHERSNDKKSWETLCKLTAGFTCYVYKYSHVEQYEGFLSLHDMRGTIAFACNKTQTQHNFYSPCLKRLSQHHLSAF